MRWTVGLLSLVALGAGCASEHERRPREAEAVYVREPVYDRGGYYEYANPYHGGGPRYWHPDDDARYRYDRDHRFDRDDHDRDRGDDDNPDRNDRHHDDGRAVAPPRLAPVVPVPPPGPHPPAPKTNYPTQRRGGGKVQSPAHDEGDERDAGSDRPSGR